MNVSVVIPTRDRRGKLESTLSALAEQDVAPYAAEVVVVDNASADDTFEATRRLAETFPFPLTVLREEKRGASAARNAGIAAATGAVVLFLGDDTRPAGRDFVRGHVECHARRPESTYAVLGRITWSPELDITPLMEWLEQHGQFAYPSIEPGPVARDYLYTSNVSIKREILLSVGGFDERIPVMFEDLEVAARLFDEGLELDYRPDLLVYHEHPTTLPAWLARQRLSGRSARVANSLGRDGPLVPPPTGPLWLAVRVVGTGLAAVPSQWAWLPNGLRAQVYRVLHLAAFARGYAENP